MHESKYIYKNIRKKQKVIDNQQEQEDKQEKLKKGDLKLDDNDVFFSSKTFNSILDQTNTSNVKCFFGINNNKNIDADETPNNIITKLEQAENEAMNRKSSLFKNSNNSILNNNNLKMNINNNNNNTINTNNNNNLFVNNTRLYIKNKYKYKENNHYLNSQNSKNIKLKMNSNINSHNLNSQNYNQNKIIINSYLSKNNQQKNEDSRKNIISSTNITDTDNENINSKNNCLTFYGNNFNNSKRKDTRKLLFENSDNKPVQIYNKTRVNQSNKNIKKQYVNTLFPTKKIISNIFNNADNNYVLKHNSFNFINQKYSKRNIKEESNNINSPNFPLSPSSIAIEADSIRKKFNLHINIKESNSTRNVVNKNKIKNINTIEKVHLKNINDKVGRNDSNLYTLNFNSKTIASTIQSSDGTSKDRIKNIYINKNFNYNKTKIKEKNQNHNAFYNFRSIVNTHSNINIKSNSNNINNNNNIQNYNNGNYIKNINNKDLNIHKIKSTSNINKPLNMNMNINMNNNSKNKLYFNEGSCGSINDNKHYNKNPLNTEFETIKNETNKRTLNVKSKKNSESNIKKILIMNNNNNKNTGTIINSNKNKTLSNEKKYYYHIFGNSPIKQNNHNENNNNDFFSEELNKKKKIILPINTNINGCIVHNGCLTSRTSNNTSKKKYNGNLNNNGQEIKYFNQDFKIKVKNKNIVQKNNNIISRNENNPIKIKKLYDNDNNHKSEHQRISGYLTYKK